MAEPKKLTTEEILAMARKQKAAGEGSAPPAKAEAESGSAEAAPAPAAPKSTADILAAARAQGGGAAKAKPASPAGSPPKSTADILAAARAQGGGAEKPAGGAAPKSTADILAAARAQGGSAAKGGAPAAAKPAAASKEPAAVPAGDRPALKDMVAVVKAADEGKPVVAPKLPGAAAKPKLPAKAEGVSRRSVMPLLWALFLSPFALAWTAMAAVAGLWGLATARFMMPNMVLELPSKFKVGPPSDFPPGTVSEKYKASRGIWIVHSDQYDGRDMIYALLTICTHLGCTPNWLEGEQKFKCPCHGSGFYITGINFEGPAPRPLERVGLRRAEDGMLEVDKSMKFQEEMGQWADAKSYFEVS